jgi:DNA-binding transcriptional regulator/RsmH inhibitor MraZ
MGNEIYGSWLVKVDDKNRVCLPVDLRRQLGKNGLFYVYIDPKNPNFQIWYELLYGTLGLSIHKYRHLILLPQRPTTNDPNLTWLWNQLNYVKIDRQGRITIYASIGYGNEVYILGQRDRIEIWPSDEYNRRMKDIGEIYKKSNMFVYDA